MVGLPIEDATAVQLGALPEYFKDALWVGSRGKRAAHDESTVRQPIYVAGCAAEDRALSLNTRSRHIYTRPSLALLRMRDGLAAVLNPSMPQGVRGDLPFYLV